MKDKVSIIVPIYNVEKYLSRCIDSLLAQTYENIEIILVDDCATDKSGEIAKDYAKKNPEKCKYVKREKNGGLAAARNTGIKEALGAWLSFIDSDDWISKNFIEHLLIKAKEKDADIVVCDYRKVYDDGKEEIMNSLADLTDDSSIEDKIAYIRSSSCSKIYKSEFWKKQNLYFPENIKRAEDLGVIFPLLTRTKKIAILNEPLYYYYQRIGSISNNIKKERIDLSFYDDAVDLIIVNAQGRYNLEIEYHCIQELMYGKTMLMIRHLYSNKEIKDHLKEFKNKYPNWEKNKYLKKYNKAKRLFIWFAGKNMIFMLRMLVKIREIIK